MTRLLPNHNTILTTYTWMVFPPCLHSADDEENLITTRSRNQNDKNLVHHND